MVVTKEELLARFNELINGQTLWSGCLTMTFVKAIYETEDFNVFDRDQLMKRLLEEWEQSHVDILIPSNPENKPYLVVSLDHPADHHAFADDKDTAILLYAANMRAGYPSRIVDTKTGESLTK
jgi:hypothetical protein